MMVEGDPASLLRLLVPFLLVLVAVACWGRSRANARPSGREPSAGPPQAATRSAHTVQPVLASDFEREQTTLQVSRAIGEGRLSIEEGGQRIDAALRARHRHELAGLVADLPPRAPPTTARPFTATPIRVALFAAALVQAIAGLWELWPLAVVALGSTVSPPHRWTCVPHPIFQASEAPVVPSLHPVD